MEKGRDRTVPSPSFLAGLIAEAGLALPPGAVEKLRLHAEEMLRWNRSIRLTAITGPEEIAVKHILDSLLLLRLGPFPGRILDFGSGAGYPGIPLAIALPESRVVLLESSAKKCAFLSYVRRMLSLVRAEVVTGRLERKNPLDIGLFDHIVTRATLPQGEAGALLLPYLVPGGRLIVMGGPGRRKTAVGRPRGGSPLPEGAAPGRTVRFELPLGMGAREVREILRIAP